MIPTVINSRKALAVFAIAFLALACAAITHAAVDPAFDATESVANVTTGTNNQTLATSSSVANVAEVKANRVLNVVAAPVASESITLGSCVVSFATTTGGVGAQDINCVDNAATIRTATTSNDIAKTAVQIAADLASLTNATSTGHGTLTVAVGTTTSKVSFTTTNTETSATPIGFTDSTGGDIVSYVSTTGVIPVAQVWTATPANVETGDIFTAIINGTTVSYTATSSTVANVTNGLAAAINASGVASAVTAADGSTLVTVTSDTAGTAFTLTSGTTNRVAVAQSVVFTPTNPGNGDTFGIIINGTSYSEVIDLHTTTQMLVEALVADLASNTDVTCTENDTSVTCTAVSAGTAFTYSADVTDGSAPTVHHGGSGGGGSHSSTANNGTATASPAAPAIAHANPNAAFLRDLTIGSTGADVTALQTWLIAKGFSIPAGATGYFGAQTRAAVIAYQKANGIVPAVGYFGPITRKHVGAQ